MLFMIVCWSSDSSRPNFSANSSLVRIISQLAMLYPIEPAPTTRNFDPSRRFRTQINLTNRIHESAYRTPHRLAGIISLSSFIIYQLRGERERKYNVQHVTRITTRRKSDTHTHTNTSAPFRVQSVICHSCSSTQSTYPDLPHTHWYTAGALHTTAHSRSNLDIS